MNLPYDMIFPVDTNITATHEVNSTVPVHNSNVHNSNVHNSSAHNSNAHNSNGQQHNSWVPLPPRQ